VHLRSDSEAAMVPAEGRCGDALGGGSAVRAAVPVGGARSLVLEQVSLELRRGSLKLVRRRSPPPSGRGPRSPVKVRC
jgi:hypothetical protein